MTNGQFQIIAGLLAEIRDALVPAREPETDACQHPEPCRVDLRSLGEREHWICSACRYEYPVTVTNGLSSGVDHAQAPL